MSDGRQVRLLDNGLRVVAASLPGSGVASVSVVYRAGFRDEQPGWSGFTHLVEHLMSQGSPHLGKLEHKTRVEGAGGWYSGQTRADCTSYISMAPAGALDLMLWADADRMLGLVLTDDNLANQVAVVEQEIRQNILSQPYGGFPCFQVDEVLFSRFENSHDGYGGFADLERVTVEASVAFHEQYYAPGNAVVGVVGDAPVDELLDRATRFFSEVPARELPVPRDVSEPPLTDVRRGTVVDPSATHSALALGYRAPDPVADFAGYQQLKLLVNMLCGAGEHALQAALQRAGAGHGPAGEVGSIGDDLASCDPAQVAIGFRLAEGRTVEEGVAVFDDALARFLDGLDDDAVRRAATGLSSGFVRSMSQAFNASLYAATLELLHGDAARIDQPPVLWRQATVEGLRSLAQRYLRPDARAVVALHPDDRTTP